MKNQVLSKKQEDNLFDFMEQRFGVYNLDWYDEDYYTENKDNKSAEMRTKVRSLGIFNHTTIKCDLVGVIWKKKDSNFANVNFKLEYQYFDMTRSASNLNINIKISENGDILEIYK